MKRKQRIPRSKEKKDKRQIQNRYQKRSFRTQRKLVAIEQSRRAKKEFSELRGTQLRRIAFKLRATACFVARNAIHMIDEMTTIPLCAIASPPEAIGVIGFAKSSNVF